MQKGFLDARDFRQILVQRRQQGFVPCNDDKAKDAKIAQYQTPWVFNILTVRLLDAKGILDVRDFR